MVTARRRHFFSRWINWRIRTEPVKTWRKERRKERKGKETRKKALVLTRRSLNIVEKLICKILCSSIPTHELNIWGLSNIPALSFFIHGNFWRKANMLPSLSSQSSLLLLTWYIRVEAVFCLVQWEGETKHYVSWVLTLVSMATLIWHNVGCQPGCPRDTENKDTLCTHLEALESIQPS